VTVRGRPGAVQYPFGRALAAPLEHRRPERFAAFGRGQNPGGLVHCDRELFASPDLRRRRRGGQSVRGRPPTPHLPAAADEADARPRRGARRFALRSLLARHPPASRWPGVPDPRPCRARRTRGSGPGGALRVRADRVTVCPPGLLAAAPFLGILPPVARANQASVTTRPTLAGNWPPAKQSTLPAGDLKDDVKLRGLAGARAGALRQADVGGESCSAQRNRSADGARTLQVGAVWPAAAGKNWESLAKAFDPQGVSDSSVPREGSSLHRRRVGAPHNRAARCFLAHRSERF
jgi:hypothetical protein